MKRYEFVDDYAVRDEDGAEYNVFDAINALPWARQLCPVMRHEYAILQKSAPDAWSVLEAMIRLHPRSYRAFFRGYQSANRYWDAPDGLRYWRGRFELDRCRPDSTEPPRRVDEEAKAIKDWGGPPWAPAGSANYALMPDGRWWPTREALAQGYEPCRACQRRPKGSESVGR